MDAPCLAQVTAVACIAHPVVALIPVLVVGADVALGVPAPLTVEDTGGTATGGLCRSTTIRVPAAVVAVLGGAAAVLAAIVSSRGGTVTREAPSIGVVRTAAETLAATPPGACVGSAISTLVAVEVLATPRVHIPRREVCLGPSPLTEAGTAARVEAACLERRPIGPLGAGVTPRLNIAVTTGPADGVRPTPLVAVREALVTGSLRGVPGAAPTAAMVGGARPVAAVRPVVPAVATRDPVLPLVARPTETPHVAPSLVVGRGRRAAVIGRSSIPRGVLAPRATLRPPVVSLRGPIVVPTGRLVLEVQATEEGPLRIPRVIAAVTPCLAA